MKDMLFQSYQHKVDEQLVRNHSILDIIVSGCCRKVNQVVTKPAAAA